MHVDLNEPLLRDLAAIGRAEEWHRLETILAAHELERAGEMMRVGFEPWRALAASWGPQNLVGLIKALTVAERRLRGWSCGSVSPVRVLYEALSVPASEKTHVANWVLQPQMWRWHRVELRNELRQKCTIIGEALTACRFALAAGIAKRFYFAAAT
jgi:hypothetical protein